MRKLFFMMMAVLLYAGLSAPAALAQDPDNGKTLWEEETWQCSRCHGPAGEGLWAGPRAGDEKTAEEWIAQVRNPRRMMPHFSEEQVSDAQIIDMHAYISSLPKVENFTPMDPGLPADAPAGQMLIAEKRCIACHTETGPINGFIERGEVPTAERVIKQLRTPFNRMPSFSPDQVSDEEAAQIAAFMADEVAAATGEAAGTGEAAAEEAPAEETPETLPASGSSQPFPLPLVLLLAGGLLLLAAPVVRRLITRV